MVSNRIRNLIQPPRSVPLGVVFSAMMGTTGFMGVIFLVVGLLSTLVFTRGIRPLDELRLALSKTTAPGIITDVMDTNSSENDAPVYEYVFEFTTDREQEMTGRNYSTGKQWSVEDRVVVEYVPDDPAIARIQGARISEFTPWVLFVLIFPAVGALMFGYSAAAGLRQVALLRYGLVADARILSTRPTGTTVNDTPVMKYSYEIRTSMGEVFQGSSKALMTPRVGDEEVEPALYLPSRPGVSALVDAISLRYPLDVDEWSGQWISRESVANAVWYALAWIAVLAMSGCCLLSFLGVVR
jgi:hypothetical protein